VNARDPFADVLCRFEAFVAQAYRELILGPGMEGAMALMAGGIIWHLKGFVNVNFSVSSGA
jgi:hypothetical protein